MKFHEISNVFPLIQGEEFSALVADIKTNGLLFHIVTYEDKILDGRNRFLACDQAGVEPRFQAYEGNDPLGFVVSTNMHRRHLTSSQSAACCANAANLRERFEAEAALRKKETEGRPKKPEEKIPQVSSEPEEDNEKERSPQSRDKLAELFGTNPRYVQDAIRIKEEDPESFEKIVSGEETISSVKRAHVANNSGNNEWYTPEKYIELARDVMGNIDLDPASSEIANNTVKRWQRHDIYKLR